MPKRFFRRLWVIAGNINTATALTGPLVGSIVASQRASGMVGGWFENPFYPLAWFLGCWVGVIALGNGARLAWIRLPRNRFHDLTEEARHLSSMFETRLEKVNGQWSAVDPEFRERILTLKSRLDDLKVPAPSIDDFDPVEWYFWLPHLASWADTKNLYEARLYHDA